jgi:predicted metalloendopeptidase
MRRSPMGFAVFSSSLALAAACGPAQVDSPPQTPPTPQPSAAVTPATPTLPITTMTLAETGIHPEWMNRTADPCTDFYEVACGTMLKNTVIPPDRSSFGPGQELEMRNLEVLKQTLESAKGASGDAVLQKLGTYYGACMDEAGIEKSGTKSLKPLVDVIGRVKDDKTLFAALIELHKHRIWPLFSVDSQQDFVDATRVIAALDQDGLGLPDKDYYLSSEPRMKEIQTFYRGHVERMLGLLDPKQSPAALKTAAEDVIRIETAMAKLQQDKVTRRDPHAVYNKIDRKGLIEKAPKLPWDAYFKALGHAEITDISVNSVSYFQGIDKLISAEKPAAWKSYLRYRVISRTAPWLGSKLVEETFALTKLLSGVTGIPPRWRRCVESADDALGELLAQPYVKTHFDGESKTKVAGLVADVRGAMKAELGALGWMDTPTRDKATQKLQGMNQKLGYPDVWRKYDFEVGADFATDQLAAHAFELGRRLGKVGKPVDRQEWQMTPPTVNAYYDPSMNEMVFPAGILQPPYFSKGFTAAVNYGDTGATMGHELTHGFDDEGSQFDATGNLVNWWSEGTLAKFKAETKCVIDQYSKYEPQKGVFINGELTAGENIADIGGLKLALAAYRAARAREQKAIAAEGYTDEQIFFIAYGQSWCTKQRPELDELMAKTNPHSMPKYRVNGVVTDVSDFAKAFSCKEGAPLAPKDRCSVW